MKSIDDYIKGVYEKYEETQKDNIVYKKVSMKYPRYSPLIKVCSIAACFILICIVGVGFNYFDKEEKIELHYVSSKNEEDDLISLYTETLFVDSRMDNTYFMEMLDSTDLIAKVSDSMVKETDFKFRNGKIELYTEGEFVIIDELFSNVENNTKTVRYIKKGGKISLNELREDGTVNWDEWEKMYIGHEVEEKEKTYFQQIPSKGCEFEEEKQYLVFLSYNEQKEIYEIFDLAYGAMEYDPTTNMVKNIDTGEFEEFDWSLITENNE